MLSTAVFSSFSISEMYRNEEGRAKAAQAPARLAGAEVGPPGVVAGQRGPMWQGDSRGLKNSFFRCKKNRREILGTQR